MLVHYAARRRQGEPISTAFIESAVNEIVAKRMNKKQQMRWSRTTVQPFVDVRTAVLNETLEDAFRHRYPGFGPPTIIKLDQRPRDLPQDFAWSQCQQPAASPASRRRARYRSGRGCP
jgi:hypothetical protein